MDNAEVTSNIWRNSASNYVFLIIRVGLGLVMFRMVYQHLGAEEFGFWSLLWSVFGYGILLDFGLGLTTLKLVAELSAQGKWEDVSTVLSTVFFFYVAVAVAICAVVLGCSGLLIDVFRINPVNRDAFHRVLMVFVCGMGAGFPIAIFPEVLVGLQRISLVNKLYSAGFLTNFVLVAVGVYQGWGIMWYTSVGLACGLLPGIIAVVYVYRLIPKLRIRPKLFSWGVIKKNLSFSLIAYINTLSGILLYKKDQLVLSTALAVSAVAIYQAAAKISEMFSAFAQQLPDTFSPAAAHLNASGDKAFLRKLLVNGTRITVLIATPGYLMAAFYLEALLRIVTGSEKANPETFWVGQILLLCAYLSLVTQGVPRRIFMMCGHEKRLMWLTIGEAILNVALTVGLVLHLRSVICVPIGTLAAMLVFGGLFLWPWAAREGNLTGWTLARTVLLPALVACLPLLGFLIIGRLSPWLDFRTSMPSFLLHGTTAGIIAVFGIWRLGLSQPEQATLVLKLVKCVDYLKRHTKARHLFGVLKD